MAVAIVIVVILLVAAVTVVRDSRTGAGRRRARCRARRASATSRRRRDRAPTPSTVDRARGDRPRARRRDARQRSGDVAAPRAAATSSSGSRSTRKSSASPAGSSSTAACSASSASRLAGFGAGVPRLPLADRVERLRRQGRTPASLDDILAYIARQAAAVLRPEARTYLVPYPKDDAAGREEGRTSPSSSRAWSRASSRCTSGACTSAAASRGARSSQWFECPCHGSKYNRGRREEGRPGAARARPLRASTVAGGDDRPSTPASIVTGSADRHQHHQAGAGRPALRLTVSLGHRHRTTSRLTLGSSPSSCGDRTSATSSSSSTSSRSSRSPATWLWTRVRRSAVEEKTPANRDAVLRRRRPRRPPARARARLGADVRRVFAVVLLVYWLREPVRQEHSDDLLQERLGRARRGAVREPVERGVQLGAVAAVRELPRHRRRRRLHDRRSSTPTDPTARRSRRRSSWKVPPLNTELLRFIAPEEVEQIITYGRPGTPMQPCGVLGGGAEERADDPGPRRVHPVDPAHAGPSARSKRPRTSSAAEAAAGAARRREGRANGDRARPADEPALADALDTQGGATTALGDPATTSDRRLRATCKALETRARQRGPRRRREQAARRRRAATFLTAADDHDSRGGGARVGAGVVRLAPGRERRAAALRAQLRALPHRGLVDVRSDRSPNSTRVLGLPGGGGGQGGGIGFNLRDGDTIRRFGPGAPTGHARLRLPASSSSRTGSEDAQAVRQRRHRHRPHARLRRDAHARDDQADRQLRALLPRQHDLPRGRRPRQRSLRRRRRPPRPRRPGGERRWVWSRLLAQHEGGAQEPLGSDDPRCPRRAVGDRAVLRLGVPAARHEPRRPARLPRRGRVPHRLHGAALELVDHDRDAARTARRAGRRRGR